MTFVLSFLILRCFHLLISCIIFFSDTAPENQTTTQGSTLVTQQSCPEVGASPSPRKLEERRTSSLDHHWAVPKPKPDSQTENDSKVHEGESAHGTEEGVTFSSFFNFCFLLMFLLD